MTQPVAAPRWARAFAAASLAVLASGAAARETPIYRCGNTYTQWPCSGAPALAIDDAPSPAERAGSLRTAAAEARWADRMRAERLAAEAHTRRALAASIGPLPAASATAPSRRQAGHRKRQSRLADTGDDFIARVPVAPKPASTK